ncbi:MAG: glycosyltransferase 87 family protein [Deltaproteobacteria bacterium]|nr:glycosyltransferase 87 family protein [Deltaproteobacteria bacterium]
MSFAPRLEKSLLLLSVCVQGAILIALGVAAAAPPGPVSRLVILSLAACVPYAAAILLMSRMRLPGSAAWAVLATAFVLRVVLVQFPPVFSDDIYRYLWDGRVILSGENPYAHAPAAPELAALRDRAWTLINYKELRTPYPPLAELLFALVALVSRSVSAFKLVAAALDTLVVALVLFLAGGRLRAQPAKPDPASHRAIVAAAAYGLNPLACVETGMSGHFEPVATALALAGLLLLKRGRAAVSSALFAAGFGVKLAPGLLWPVAARKNVRALLVFPVLAAAFYLPFLSVGSKTVEMVDTYARRWEGNAGLFAIVKAGFERLIGVVAGVRGDGEMIHLRFLDEPAAALQGTFFSLHKDGAFDAAAPGAFALGDLSLVAAKLTLALLVIALVATLVARRAEPIRASAWILGALVVVTPVLHPWYLLWILPLAAVLGQFPWFVLAALAPLAYLPLDAWWAFGRWDMPAWIPWVEHGAFAVSIAAMVALRSRAARGERTVDPCLRSK